MKNSPRKPQLPLIPLGTSQERSRTASEHLANTPGPLSDVRDYDKSKIFSPHKDRCSIFFPSTTHSSNLGGNMPTTSAIAPSQTSIVVKKPKSIDKRSTKSSRFDMFKSVLELKTSLEKYKQPDAQYLFPLRSDVKKTVQCLELLNEYNRPQTQFNNFDRSDSALSDIMDIITKILKSSIYINPKIFENIRGGLAKSDNEELKELISKSESSYVPYYTLCTEILQELTVQDSKRFDAKTKFDNQLKSIKSSLTTLKSSEGLNDMLEQKERHITSLQEELSNSVPNSIHHKTVDELKTVKEALNNTSEENKKQKGQIKTLTDENNHLLKVNEDEMNENEKFSKIIECNKIEKQEMSGQTDDLNKQLDSAREKFGMLQSSFDSVVNKLEILKNKISGLQTKNDELEGENRRLRKNMASAGTGDLTPRPSYKSLQKEHKINLNIFDLAGKKQVIPTTRVVEELIKKLCNSSANNTEGTPDGGRKNLSLFGNIRSPRRSQTGTSLGSQSARLVNSKSQIIRKPSISKTSPRGSVLVTSNNMPPVNMKPRRSQFYESSSNQNNVLNPNRLSPNIFLGDNLNPIEFVASKNESSPKSRDGSADSNDQSTPSAKDNTRENSPSNMRSNSIHKPSDLSFSVNLEILRQVDIEFTADALTSTEELIRYVTLTRDIATF